MGRRGLTAAATLGLSPVALLLKDRWEPFSDAMCKVSSNFVRYTVN